MGRRGPPREPRELTIAKGNPSRRVLPAAVVVGRKVGPQEPPPAPDELSDDAAAVWEEVAPIVVTAGTYQTGDQNMLMSYCESVALEQRSRREMRGQPLTEKTARGGTKENTLIKTARDAAALSAKLGSYFGLSPSSRASIGTYPESAMAARQRLHADMITTLDESVRTGPTRVMSAAEERRRDSA